MNKKIIAAALLGIGELHTASAADAAADFPSKAVRIVVPFAAGGTSDVLARTLGQKLSETWKQPVIVENKPGADGNLGADSVAKSRADGYTVLLVDTSTLTISPWSWQSWPRRCTSGCWHSANSCPTARPPPRPSTTA